MNDNEYIRTAVELADGFSWEWTQPRKELLIRFGTVAVNMTNTVYSPWMLDSLAAQLASQVDALEKYSVITESDCSIVHHFEGNYSFADSGAESNDRTMNTIKAIVDSEVLK